ncbi:unnamed protein product, partial [Porites lobata]
PTDCPWVSEDVPRQFEPGSSGLRPELKTLLLLSGNRLSSQSNMVLALTSPLTCVKDVAKYITSLRTPLTSVKSKYDRYTFTTLLNGVKGESRYATNITSTNTYKPTPNRLLCRVWELF